MGIDGLFLPSREARATHLSGWRKDSCRNLTDWRDLLLGPRHPNPSLYHNSNFRKYTANKSHFPIWGEDGGQIASLEKEILLPLTMFVLMGVDCMSGSPASVDIPDPSVMVLKGETLGGD